MFKKRYITLAVLTFLVCILAASAASAADGDNLTDDALAIDASDEGDIAIEEDNGEEIISSPDDTEAIAVDEDGSDDVASVDEGQEVLSYGDSPEHTEYNVEFGGDTYVMPPKGAYAVFKIDPCYDTYYSYDFYLKIYDLNGIEKFSDEVYDTDMATSAKCLVDPLPEGTYTMKIINYEDDYEFDSATLIVTKIPTTITTSGYYSSYYNSNSKYTVMVKSQLNSAGVSGVKIKIQFKKGGKTVTKYYTTGSGGKVSIVPPVGVGTWTATVSLADSSYTGASKTNTIKITKSGVKIKVKKVSQYQKIKFQLKATVKSQSGKAVKEGKVKFKINHKTYTVSVKNGVATKTLKIGKVKTYKFTAKYLGTANYKKSKTAKNKVKIKQRYKVKISFKKTFKGRAGKSKTLNIKITTKKGHKKVKDGYVFIVNKDTGGYAGAYVKHGKAKFKINFLNEYRGYAGYVDYYSKKNVKRYSVKYFPKTYKYYPSGKKTLKVISLYKCGLCGKTKSHSHGSGFYKYYIKVV